MKTIPLSPYGLTPSGYALPPLCGIVPNSLWLLDSSSRKFQCATLLKLGTHYD